MIVCVTLNPCVDKTLEVPGWAPGDSVRGTSIREVAGGKGNNVARALKRLGRDARPALPLGGAVGRHCEELLRVQDGLDPITAPTDAPTRVILTVRGADSSPPTAFFDPAPELTVDEAANLLSRVESVLRNSPVEALTLSGSSPSPATHGLFADLISMARARRIPVFLDTYGPALESIWGFWPEVIHMNRDEAADYLQREDPDEEALRALLDRFIGHGVRLAVITDGPGPILARSATRRFAAIPPEVDEVNPVGSGDCLLAGMVDAWLAGLDEEAILRRGIACAVANVMAWDAGAIDPEAVRGLETAAEVRENSDPDGLPEPPPPPTDGPKPGGPKPPKPRYRHRVA